MYRLGLSRTHLRVRHDPRYAVAREMEPSYRLYGKDPSMAPEGGQEIAQNNHI